MNDEQVTEINHYPELLYLEFTRTRLISDMEIEKERFIAKGHTIEEAKEGISFLMSQKKQ